MLKKIDFILLMLFMFCISCGPNPKAAQQAAASAQNKAIQLKDSSCGRLFYPKYIDVDNQLAVENEIQSGSAHLILHFKEAGQEAIDTFLQNNSGIIEVGYQWPDWGSLSLVVNESGLRQLQKDCSIELIEADKQEQVQ